MQQSIKFIPVTPFLMALILGVGNIAMSGVVNAQGIKKCQDAEGNWHYGTVAAEACAESVIDELNESGTKVGENLPPPSEEELQRKAALSQAIEEQQEFSVEQRKSDLEIVRIYGSEDSIIATRDRKIEAIDNNIDVTRQIKAGTLKDIDKLEKMKQTQKVKKLLDERVVAVESYDRVISHNLGERDKLADKYDQVLLDFRAAYKRVYGE